MKGKLVVVIASMLVVSAIPDVSGNAPFNPMLPSHIRYFANETKLPLDLFEPGNSRVIDLAYNRYCDRFCRYIVALIDFDLISSYQIDNPLSQYQIDVNESGIDARKKGIGYAFEQMNLGVTISKVVKDKKTTFVMDFFDLENDRWISKQIVENPNATLEFISKNLFRIDDTMYDVQKGSIGKKTRDYYGISSLYYGFEDGFYRRIDDSFVFSMANYKKYGYFCTLTECEDFLYLAKKGKTAFGEGFIDLIRCTFTGKALKRWNTRFLHPEDIVVEVRGDFFLTQDLHNTKGIFFRFWNAVTGDLVWSLPVYDCIKDLRYYGFDGDNFYGKSSNACVRITPDGTKTFVPFRKTPTILKLFGNQYLLKGTPSSDSQNLICKLAFIKPDTIVETEMIVPDCPFYGSNWNTIIGYNVLWRKLDNDIKLVADYSIQKITAKGISQPAIGSTIINGYSYWFDMDHMQIVEQYPEGRFIIKNLELGTSKEINLSKADNEEDRQLKISYAAAAGNRFALLRFKEGDPSFQVVTIYRLSPFKRIFHSQFQTDPSRSRMAFRDEFCPLLKMTDKYLLFWSSSLPFHLLNLEDLSCQAFDDWQTLKLRNDGFYALTFDRDLDYVDYTKLQNHRFDLPKGCPMDDMLMFLVREFGSSEIFQNDTKPQQQLGNEYDFFENKWFASMGKAYGDFFKMEKCPTFSIKRSSNDEFQITNTSPNCDRPLNANIYLIRWSDQGCPAYWQARNVVGKINSLKLDETTAIKLSDLPSLQSKRFALVIESNGLLDTRNSELSDFDKTGRPLFDGNSISYEKQQSVVVTVWGK